MNDPPILEVGSPYGTAGVVVSILCPGPKVRVFITDGGELHIEPLESDVKTSDQVLDFLASVHDLRLSIRNRVPRRDRDEAYERLGRDVCTALHSSQPPSTNDRLGTTRTFIETAINNRAKFVHTVTSLLVMIFPVIALIILATNLLKPLDTYLYGAVWGCIGTFISLMTRSVDTTQSESAVVVDHMARMVLGAFFGLIVILAAGARLLPKIGEGLTAAYSLSTVAGYSERFAIGLFRRWSRDTGAT